MWWRAWRTLGAGVLLMLVLLGVIDVMLNAHPLNVLRLAPSKQEIAETTEYHTCLHRVTLPLKVDVPPPPSRRGVLLVNCQRYYAAAGAKRTDYMFFYNSKPLDNPRDRLITLAVHLNMKRLDRLEQIAAVWPGDISAAVYVTGEEMEQLGRVLCNSLTFRQRTNIFIHLSLSAGHSDLYPINHMRNVALNGVLSEFVLHLDVDFLPGPTLHDELHKLIQSHHAKMDHEVLVVPAYDLISGDILPNNKSDVINMMQDLNLSPSLFGYWKPSHAPTDYVRALRQDKPYYVEWREQYEPYIVIKTSLSPKFSKQFVGRWYDKMTYLLEVAANRFKFLVLPEVFITHKPHEVHTREIYKGIVRCARAQYEYFITYIHDKYGFTVTKLS